MSKHFEKFYVIHLWLGQHDALSDPNYDWCGPHTVSQLTQWAVGSRPGSAGVVCWPPHIEKISCF